VIPVYEPWISDLEKEYAKQAIDSTWISSNGEFIARAEKLFGEFIGSPHVIVANNGTTALHLCCRAANMKSGDVVLVPACTYAATAFAPLYCGAEVKYVDVDPHTWNIDLDQVEEVCRGQKIDYVIPVHLFGNPVDMHRLNRLAHEYGFDVIEDACESIGATIDGEYTGRMGKLAAFSFYGNKTFTSGEGGALVAQNATLAEFAKMLRGQGQSFDRRYWHLELGYNYRMTNVQAAILCAQIERSQEILSEKKRVATRYKSIFQKSESIEMQRVLTGHKHGSWMIVIKTPLDAETLAAELKKVGIDSRPMFYPLNEMPPLKTKDMTPVSKGLSERCLMLPSSPLLDDEKIDFVCESVVKALDVSARTHNCRPV
jgi:perosamine synthetase